MGASWLGIRAPDSVGANPDSAHARRSPGGSIRPMESRLGRLGLIAALWASLSTCQDGPLPTEVLVQPPSSAISDGAHTGGNPGFFFLPPLVPDPSTHEDFDADGFDPTRIPTVEICALDGSECSGAQPEDFPITYTMTSGLGSELIRLVEEEQHFAVNWHTDLVALDPAMIYRIRVLVGANIELGFADVDVVGGGQELRNVDTGTNIALKDGRTLPIRFRIETDATEAPADVAIEVAEAIRVTDQTNLLEPVILAVTETIQLGDEVRVIPPVTLNVAEVVRVADDASAVPPASIAVTEAIGVTDAPVVAPPAIITVAEAVTVTDAPAVVPPAAITVAEAITVTDAPVVAPPAAITVAEAITVTDAPVVAPPAVITVVETITVTDLPAVSTP